MEDRRVELLKRICALEAEMNVLWETFHHGERTSRREVNEPLDRVFGQKIGVTPGAWNLGQGDSVPLGQFG